MRDIVGDDQSRERTPGRVTRRALAGAVAAGAAAAAYMVFEAQWIRCRRADLPVPGLPPQWSDLTILHLSDVHAGSFATNERSLRKAVRWAQPLAPDLVFLTGDILGDPEHSRRCLTLLSELEPGLGMYAVTGNHEYGLGKSLFARPRDTGGLWREAGITLLSDSCVVLPPREGSTLIICGADHITGGYGLIPDARPLPTPGEFPILLIHSPPPPDSPLTSRFRLTFAGHTHGGQLRIPTRSGLRPLHHDDDHLPAGIHPWGTVCWWWRRGSVPASSPSGCSPGRRRPCGDWYTLLVGRFPSRRVNPRQGATMTELQEERFSGDLPVTAGHFTDDEGPSVSHEVIASYVADAARSVPGIVALHSSHWRSLSSRVHETRSGGIVVRDRETGGVDVEIHAEVAWGSVIPELAAVVEAAVRKRVVGLLNLDLDSVTLYVDEIAGPVEEKVHKKS